MRFSVAALVVSTLVLGFVGAAVFRDEPSADPMVAAALAWLSTLTVEQRAEASIAFDDAERRNWHYVPRTRKGVTIGAMSPEARRAVHALLRSGLGSRGYLKASAIIALEDVLRELEEAGGRRAPHRNPDHYTLALFGTPAADRPWGWRLEGHHLSLNFSSVTHGLVAATPTFLGANPAEVPRGARAGLRVLAAEEDLGLELMRSLGPQQRQRAVIAEGAPRDVVFGPGRRVDSAAPAGLPASELDEAARALLWRLIEEYAHNLRHDIAHRELERIRAAGLDGVHFAWAGPVEAEARYYYRIHGPSFVVELDRTAGGSPGHVHTLWRDPAGDFGDDLLRRHRERHHDDGSGKRVRH